MTEGQFFMNDFQPRPQCNGPNAYLPERRDLCGTACCIAGNILLASGMPAETLTNMRGYEVEAGAREAWASEYGWPEANRLQFTESGWGEKLEDVLPEEACAHLRGAEPVRHEELVSYDDIRSGESDY